MEAGGTEKSFRDFRWSRGTAGVYHPGTILRRQKPWVPHPSVLRVRVFLRCATLYDAITDEATCTLLPSVVTGDAHSSGRGTHAIASCECLNEVRSRHGFKLLGYVVMPEHVHAKKDGEINSPLQKRKGYCGPVR